MNKSEIQAQLDKAEKQLKAAKENNAPTSVIEFAEKKIERLKNELSEVKEAAPAPAKKKADKKAKKTKKQTPKQRYEQLKSWVKRGEVLMEEEREEYLELSKKFDKKDKQEEKKSQPKDRSGVKIVEKDGVTLVSLESEPQWVVNIVEKNGKFKADCCSDDEVEIKSSTDINEVIDDAIEYLQCKKMFKATKEQRKIAKKRRDRRVKAGKPAEKTPGETADDAAKKVVDKIEKKVEKGKPIVSDEKSIIAAVKEQFKAIKKADEKPSEKVVAEVKSLIKMLLDWIGEGKVKFEGGGSIKTKRKTGRPMPQAMKDAGAAYREKVKAYSLENKVTYKQAMIACAKPK